MDSPRNQSSDRLKHQHAALFKLKTPPWKETFRERCLQRFRKNRGKLVDKFRGLEVCPDEKTADVLMKEEWNSGEGQDNPLQNLFPGSTDELDEDEINEILSMMEEIQAELVEEERRFLEEYSSNEACNLDSTVSWLDKDDVICPICQRNILHQLHSVIFCSCGVRIDVQQDGLTLKDVKFELNKGLDMHEETCDDTPRFSLLNVSEYTNMAMTCETCNFMYIII